jgi:hypothetical protein
VKPNAADFDWPLNGRFKLHYLYANPHAPMLTLAPGESGKYLI